MRLRDRAAAKEMNKRASIINSLISSKGRKSLNKGDGAGMSDFLCEKLDDSPLI